MRCEVPSFAALHDLNALGSSASIPEFRTVSRLSWNHVGPGGVMLAVINA